MRLRSFSGAGLVFLAVLAGCGDLGPTDDSSAPQVVFETPLDAAIVSGVVNIKVLAVDDVGVVSVKIYVDNAFLLEDASLPYEAIWNTGALADNSNHTLRAEAKDPSGNTRTAQITVTVVKQTPL